MLNSKKINFDRMIWWGISFSILFSAMAIGTLHYETRSILFLVIGSLGLLLAGTFYRSGSRVYFDGMVFWFLLVIGLLILQVLPLGMDRLAEWSPMTARIHKNMGEILGRDPVSWITLDRSATMLSLGHAFAYLGFYIVTFNFALRTSNAKKVAGVIAALGIITGLVGLAHFLTGTNKILWIYKPDLADDLARFHTFLVNPNHSAALFNLSAMTFLGLGRDSSTARPRLIHSFFFVLASAGTFATMSRGGIMAYLAAMVLYYLGGSMAPAASDETPKFSPSAFVLGMVMILGVAGLFLVGNDFVKKSLEENKFFSIGENETKLNSWEDSMKIGDDFVNTGIGRGAFRSVFPAYNATQPDSVFHYVENEPLQALLDFGLRLGVPLLFTLLWVMMRRLVWGLGQPLGIGLACGVIAVGFQNMVDFSLSIPGIAIPTIAALATLSGIWRHKLRRKVLAVFRFGALKWLMIAVPLAFLPLAVNMWYAHHSLDAARELVVMAAESRELSEDDLQQVDEVLDQALQDHPADFDLAMVGSALHQRHGSMDKARTLMAHALIRNPRSAGVHLAYAILFKKLDRLDDSLNELRWILLEYPERATLVYQILLSWNIPESRMAEILHTEGLEYITGYVSWLMENKQRGRSEVMLKAAIKAHGKALPLLARLGFLYFNMRFLPQADNIATYIIALYPDSPSGYLLQARIFSVQGKQEDALLMYEDARVRSDDQVPVSLEMMNLLVLVRQWDRFEAIASQIRRPCQSNPGYKAQFHRILAARERLREKPYAALAELEQAESVMPLNAQVALDKAAIYMSLGAADRAAFEYRKVLKINPGNQAATLALRQLESSSIK